MRRDDTLHDRPIDYRPCYTVHVSCNVPPQGSWQAELAFGPADRIIVDGRSATHAVQQLLAILPAALAARIALAYKR